MPETRVNDSINLAALSVVCPESGVKGFGFAGEMKEGAPDFQGLKTTPAVHPDGSLVPACPKYNWNRQWVLGIYPWLVRPRPRV